MNEFFTWEFLATMAGAVVGTGLITQFLKGIFKALPTQILSYIIALFILIVSSYFNNTLTLSIAVLSLFNAMLVSTSANGGYSAIERMRK